MRWDMLTTTAFGGLAALFIGGALLLADAPALFVPVLGMVAGVAAVATANHERLKLRIGALEQRIAQAEWRDGVNRGDAA
jgi:hypothetical protein